MKMCEENHDEIVFEGGIRNPCPLCSALEEIKELQKEVEKLEELLTPISR